ncbi:MAG: leucine-rich repeat domain-containing protein [Ruminococcus sp.]|nr:leucine-rich repeat domain-containing protein [Ruminococcus sp.]
MAENNVTEEKKDSEDLRFLTDSDGKTIIKYLANESHIIIPDGTETIGDGAFKGKKLTSVTIPPTVHTIGHYAFYGCRKLTSIEIPAGVINIGDYAFKGCKNLVALEIPKSVRRIGKGACDYTAVCMK